MEKQTTSEASRGRAMVITTEDVPADKEWLVHSDPKKLKEELDKKNGLDKKDGLNKGMLVILEDLEKNSSRSWALVSTYPPTSLPSTGLGRNITSSEKRGSQWEKLHSAISPCTIGSIYHSICSGAILVSSIALYYHLIQCGIPHQRWC
jgi:hypothetical protein